MDAASARRPNAENASTAVNAYVVILKELRIIFSS
jgi:hypothetical protein